jgi:aryl-alcohol dehydrogenase-like predicted oxidoreductase
MHQQFKLGDFSINRIGFGSMRITGKGIWGEPDNREECIRTLKRAPAVGVNFIDTADSYGPDVSENLIREALYPYTGLMIATKGGLTRHGDNIWAPLGRPEYLRQCVLMSMRRLGVEQIDLWQLHRIDVKVPRDEQFDAVASFQKEGLIKYVGLSEVSVDDIKAAQQYFKVDTVQNQYNFTQRQYEDVLDYCTEQNIGFIPWYPLAKGTLSQPDSVFATIAQQYDATPGQIALAWLLKRSPVVIPIPGTSQQKHLEENVKALSIDLSDADFDAIAKIKL